LSRFTCIDLKDCIYIHHYKFDLENKKIKRIYFYFICPDLHVLIDCIDIHHYKLDLENKKIKRIYFYFICPDLHVLIDCIDIHHYKLDLENKKIKRIYVTPGHNDHVIDMITILYSHIKILI
jgi:hypothetical protein